MSNDEQQASLLADPEASAGSRASSISRPPESRRSAWWLFFVVRIKNATVVALFPIILSLVSCSQFDATEYAPADLDFTKSSSSSWISLSSAKGRFGVSLPGKPEVESNVTGFPVVGEVGVHSLIYGEGPDSFSLLYYILPLRKYSSAEVKQFIDVPRKLLLKDAALIEERDLGPSNGLETKQISVWKNQGSTRWTARISVVQNRIYVMLAIVRKGSPKEDSVQEFLESFKPL